VVWCLRLCCCYGWQMFRRRALTAPRQHYPPKNLSAPTRTSPRLTKNLTLCTGSVLSKASADEKQQIIAQQKHWLKHTRNVCTEEVCFKHAYWERQAQLATFFAWYAWGKEWDKVAIRQKAQEEAIWYESSLSAPPVCSDQWFYELDIVCGNPSAERCYNMIGAARKVLNEQLECVTSRLDDSFHESFLQAHAAWKQYRDLECESLVPQCGPGRTAYCTIPPGICEAYRNCKQIDHLYYIKDNNINGYNGSVNPKIPSHCRK